MSGINESNVGELASFLKDMADEKQGLDARSKDLKERIKSTAEAYEVDVSFINAAIKAIIDEGLDDKIAALDEITADLQLIKGALQ